MQPRSDDSFASPQQSVLISNACFVDSADGKSTLSVLPKLHVDGLESGNAPPPVAHRTAMVQLCEVKNKKQSDFDRNLTCPSVVKGENSKDAMNENAYKRNIKSLVSKSRIPKSHASRGPNTLNLIEIELSNNLNWDNHTSASQPPSYCVPLIRRGSGDQCMVYLYSPQSRPSLSLHKQGLNIQRLSFPAQNKIKKHVHFVE